MNHIEAFRIPELHKKCREILTKARQSILAKTFVAEEVIKVLESLKHRATVNKSLQTKVNETLVRPYYSAYSLESYGHRLLVWGGPIEHGSGFRINGQTYAELIEDAKKWLPQMKQAEEEIDRTIKVLESGELDKLYAELVELSDKIRRTVPGMHYLSNTLYSDLYKL
jgi:hypothetical protein